jgi:hypothetical protein
MDFCVFPYKTITLLCGRHIFSLQSVINLKLNKYIAWIQSLQYSDYFNWEEH